VTPNEKRASVTARPVILADGIGPLARYNAGRMSERPKRQLWQLQPKKRQFWRFHLSTSIKMTLAATLMIGLNFVPDISIDKASFLDGDRIAYGFPWKARLCEMIFTVTVPSYAAPNNSWVRFGLIADICITLAVILAIGAASELSARRREARRQ
jgi:hypothetical protein